MLSPAMLVLHLTLALLVSSVLGVPSPAPDAGTLTPSSPHSTFVSQIQDDVKLRFVKNSGVCETTPGVNQMSGYIDIGTNMSMVDIVSNTRMDIADGGMAVVLVL